jgi:hypothetical protein
VGIGTRNLSANHPELVWWRDRGTHASSEARVPRSATRIRASALGVRFDEFDRVFDRQDFFGRIVGNFNAEFFLKRHDKLDIVQAVCTEIIDEARVLGNLLSVHAEMLDDDLLQAFSDITHFKSSDPWF